MNTELLKHRLDPYCLICAIRRAFFSTSVLERDTIGYLRELQEIKIRSKKNGETTSGPAIIRTTHPVSIGINIQQACRRDTLNVPKDPFDSLIMHSSELSHVRTPIFSTRIGPRRLWAASLIGLWALYPAGLGVCVRVLRE
jgi:hypothetical protein